MRNNLSWCQWLIPINLATQEAEIRRFEVQSHPDQIVQENLSQKKKKSHKKKKKCSP
jgi:hypothetical protein